MTGSGKDPGLIATASQTVGPFFHFALTPDGVRNEGRPDTAAPAMQLVVRVTDGQGQAVGDAMIEIWVARGDGPCAFARRVLRRVHLRVQHLQGFLGKPILGQAVS